MACYSYSIKQIDVTCSVVQGFNLNDCLRYLHFHLHLCGIIYNKVQVLLWFISETAINALFQTASFQPWICVMSCSGDIPNIAMSAIQPWVSALTFNPLAFTIFHFSFFCFFFFFFLMRDNQQEEHRLKA